MRLLRATEEQRTARDASNYPVWGPPLTIERYIEREKRLRDHAWSRAELCSWLLCTDDGSVLSSCETYRMDSFLRARNGALLVGDSYGIASVFTEERLRGRGYATRLMDLVATALERTSPGVHTSLLFSDVGAPLYRRSGYQETLAWSWRFPPDPGEPSALVDRLLPETEMGAALARMRQPQAPFFYWPTAAQLDWHLERERIYAEQRPRPHLEANGALAGESTALWYMMGRTGTLMVLMFDARTAEDAAALLGAAQRTAHRAGLTQVELWEEPATAPLVAKVPGGMREARAGALPMLRPLRPGLPSTEATPIPRALWV